MRSALVILLLAPALLAARCPGPPPPDVHGDSHGCVASADDRARDWAAQGLPSDEIDRRYELAVASCAPKEVKSATAVFVGAVNIDWARLARMIAAGQLAPGPYMERVRDRASKMRLADADPDWATRWIAGDADGDLVPDSLDDCPGTEDLAPTDDFGCLLPPNLDLYHIPVAKDVEFHLDHLGVMRSPACDGAPIPEMPAPLRMGDTVPNNVRLGIAPVSNQPAGCMVFYELRVNSFGYGYDYLPIDRWHWIRNEYRHMVLRDVEAISTKPHELVFEMTPASHGDQYALWYDYIGWAGHRWQVRAVNGNGLASSWSGHLTSRTGQPGRWVP